MTDIIREVTTASFELDVLQASGEVPVLVDFWAPWCAPCRALKPVLEKLAREYGGRFLLAKVNTDEQPEIAQRYGIRGIPDVKAFVGGKVVAEFTGAIPERAARAFIDKLLPTPGEKLRQSAQQAVQQGEFENAESRLREALAVEPGHVEARLDLAQLLVARQSFEDADAVLAELTPGDGGERAADLRRRIELWRRARELPPLLELRQALERAPDDLETRLRLAERHAADGDNEAALEQLLSVVRADRGEWRGRARTMMVDLFRIAPAEQADLVARYRRLLAAELN